MTKWIYLPASTAESINAEFRLTLAEQQVIFDNKETIIKFLRSYVEGIRGDIGHIDLMGINPFKDGPNEIMKSFAVISEINKIIGHLESRKEPVEEIQEQLKKQEELKRQQQLKDRHGE